MNKKLFISALFIALLSITIVNARVEDVVLSLTLKYISRIFIRFLISIELWKE